MARIELISSGVVEVLQSAGVEAHLRTKAEGVAAAATGSAPRETGEYAASISVSTEHHRDRVVAIIKATAPHSMAVEARTGNLARALGAAR